MYENMYSHEMNVTRQAVIVLVSNISKQKNTHQFNHVSMDTISTYE